MSKSFKTIKPINSKQQYWSNFTIPIGTIVEQIPDTKNLISPIKGITVEYIGWWMAAFPAREYYVKHTDTFKNVF